MVGAASVDDRRALSPVLIGRERELERLARVASAPPCLTVVEGEAGVGKSRLVREAFAPGHSDALVLVGRCHRLREPFLLGPVIEALEGASGIQHSEPLSAVAGALGPLLPELEGLPPVPAPTGDPAADRHRLFRGARELLGALGPAVCVLEDLHWADAGTREFLAFLVSKPPPSLALVLTYRGEDLAPSSPLPGLASQLAAEAASTTIHLAPLGVDEVRRLLCAMLETEDVSHEAASYLHEQTAGIPFALEEVIRLLRARGQIALIERGRRPGDVHAVAVPPAIGHSIRERLESVPGDARSIARAAAVVGLPAGEEILTEVADLPEGRAAGGLTAALACALLERKSADRYGFRHALAAQAVYEEIPGPECRRLHLRAAGALEEGPDPPSALLAHHYEQGNRPKRWAPYAEEAAAAARAAGDHRGAARLLARALDAPGLARAARVRIASKLSAAALYSDHPEAVIEKLQRTLEADPMPVAERGELRYWISRLRCQTGDRGAWRAEMERAAGELSQRRPELAARAMVNLAWPAYGEEPLERHLVWLDRAVEAAGALDDRAARTAVLSQRASILMSVGDRRAGQASREMPSGARSAEEKLQLLRAYHSLAVMALGLGYHARAEELLGEVERLDGQLDHVSWGPWRDSVRVAIDWRTGRWERLEPRVRALGDRLAGRAGIAAANDLLLGGLLLARGRVDEAERLWSEILQRARANGWMSSQVSASAGYARARLAQGDAAGAWEAARCGLDVVRRKGIWCWGREVVPVAIHAALADGGLAEASELAEELAHGLRDRDAPAARAASVQCLAVVAEARGDHEAARERFARAEAQWAGLPAPYEAAQAREGSARCLLAGDDEAGSALLLEALRAFEALRASWDAARVRSELKARGIPAPAHALGGRRGYGVELSPREAEVARLAGVGRKNREIAELLFISPRTVEDHVASALRKLGARSRRELESLAGGR